MATSTSTCQWQYVDDDGHVQGPFPDDQMTAWYAAQYFDRDRTKCRRVEVRADGTRLAAGEEPVFQLMRDVFPPAMQAAGGSLQSSSEQPQPQADHDEPQSDSSTHEPPTPSPITSDTQWYYKDESNTVQGPFGTDMMRAWYAAGYFPSSTLVRTSSDTDFVAVADRPAHSSFVVVDAVATAPTSLPSSSLSSKDESAVVSASSQNAGGSVSASSNDVGTPSSATSTITSVMPPRTWFYVDKDGVEHGPWSAAQMRAWHDKGFFHFNSSCKIRESTEDVSHAKPLSEWSVPPGWASSPSSSSSSSLKQTLSEQSELDQWEREQDERWYFLDDEENERGPWTTARMRKWWQAGYLPTSVHVRMVGEYEFSTITERQSARSCSFTRPGPVARPSLSSSAASSSSSLPYTSALASTAAVTTAAAAVTTAAAAAPAYYHMYHPQAQAYNMMMMQQQQSQPYGSKYYAGAGAVAGPSSSFVPHPHSHSRSRA